mgnify:CR=1 FL=1
MANKGKVSTLKQRSKKARVRFPNESEYTVVENFKFSDFKFEEEYDYDVFGKYKGTHVMLNKDDYHESF